MAPIRVAHVIPDLLVGGAETALVRLLEGLDRERFVSLVVTLRDGGALVARAERAATRVVSLGMRTRLPSPATIARLRATLRGFAPEVVQGWMYHGNLAASLGARLVPERPAVVWNVRQSLASVAHEPLHRRLAIRAGALLSATADRIIDNSETSARQHAAIGFDASRFAIIANGFDPELFRPSAAARAALRAELGLAPETLLVGMVARVDPVKRHDLFLAAIAHAVRQGLDVHAVLAGSGTEADAASAPLARLVAHAGLAGRVHLLGERPDVERVMPALDVLVSASGWAEGFPNVIGEAMSCGVPCLVTDTGDCATIVGDCGVVVPPGDGGAVCRALEVLLRLPREQRVALGQRGRLRVASEFSLEQCTTRYAALYSDVAGTRLQPSLRSTRPAATTLEATFEEPRPEVSNAGSPR